jgi:nucleotide-binding universal stress UspA family protein
MVNPMDRRRWIVVGTDFSDASARALDHAVRWAAERGARVACVHAYEDPPGGVAHRDPAPDMRAQIEDMVSHSEAADRAVPVEPIVRRGAPWDKLANVAADLDAELIVVGATGQRRAPHQFFLGSVASRLAATSTRAVLVVPWEQV